jgi:hypothetical protein
MLYGVHLASTHDAQQFKYFLCKTEWNNHIFLFLHRRRRTSRILIHHHGHSFFLVLAVGLPAAFPTTGTALVIFRGSEPGVLQQNSVLTSKHSYHFWKIYFDQNMCTMLDRYSTASNM